MANVTSFTQAQFTAVDGNDAFEAINKQKEIDELDKSKVIDPADTTKDKDKAKKRPKGKVRNKNTVRFRGLKRVLITTGAVTIFAGVIVTIITVKYFHNNSNLGEKTPPSDVVTQQTSIYESETNTDNIIVSIPQQGSGVNLTVVENNKLVIEVDVNSVSILPYNGENLLLYRRNDDEKLRSLSDNRRTNVDYNDERLYHLTSIRMLEDLLYSADLEPGYITVNRDILETLAYNHNALDNMTRMEFGDTSVPTSNIEGIMELVINDRSKPRPR